MEILPSGCRSRAPPKMHFWRIYRDNVRVVALCCTGTEPQAHRRYRAEIGGKVYFVDVAGRSDKDEIAPGTLTSMIRQSGLPKRLFRR